MPRRDLAQAVGTLLRADPARIHAVASRLDASDRFLESTVEGMSMSPTLTPGSRIRIELVEHASYEVGDVIAFLVRGQVIVHRVVHRSASRATAGQLLTRGDATVVPDPPVDLFCILGPVTGVCREGAWAEPGRASRRGLRARLVSGLVLRAAKVALSLSPPLATWLLTSLHRAERAVHFALVRSLRVRQPTPPRAY